VRLGVGVESTFTGDGKLAIGERHGSAGQDDGVDALEARTPTSIRLCRRSDGRMRIGSLASAVRTARRVRLYAYRVGDARRSRSRRRRSMSCPAALPVRACWR
jgi:hypothetical protein